MFSYWSTLLLALLVPSLALHVQDQINHENKEYVYSYHAEVKAGTTYPVPHASKFVLEGKFHMKMDMYQNSTYAYLSDLTYKLYNGRLNNHDEHAAHSVPVPTEVAEMSAMFQMIEDGQGKVVGVITGENEKPYVRNFKKSLASLFSLDSRVLHTESDMGVFHTTEETVYKKVKAAYEVQRESDQITVLKAYDVTKSLNQYNILVRNIDPLPSQMPIEGFILPSNIRKYRLKVSDGKYILKMVNAIGELRVSPFNGKSETQYIMVNQTLELLEMMDPKSQYSIPNGVPSHDLAFEVVHSREVEHIPDLSMGRGTRNQQLFVTLVYSILDEAVNYIRQNHIKMEHPNIKDHIVIYRLRRVIQHLDVISLETVHNHLSEKMGERDLQVLDIFYQTVPLAGTRATTLFITGLIKKNKLKESSAIQMLSKMPFYLIAPTQKLVTDVEDLINLNTEIRWSVRKAALLSFATMVHKVYTHKQLNHHRHYDQSMHSESVEDPQLNAFVEKYVSLFFDRMKMAEDYEMQMVYMETLLNIKVENVFKYLEPIIKGEPIFSYNHHLRLLAMWVSYYTETEPEKLFEVYAPIMLNRNLHLELRTTALDILIKMLPSKAKMLKLYWIMRYEPCTYMYHYYYTTLTSLAKSMNPAMQEYRSLASQLLRYVRVPEPQQTGAYIFDYQDPEYNFGGGWLVANVHTPTSRMFYLENSGHLFNMPMSFSSIMIKIHGLEDALDVETNVDHSSILHNWQHYGQLMKLLVSLPALPKLHIEYVATLHDHVVYSEHYNHSNINTLMQKINGLRLQQLDFFKSSVDVSSKLAVSIVAPTEIGFPLVMEVFQSSVSYGSSSFSKDGTDGVKNYHFDLDMRVWSHAMLGMKFYNPVADIWQGVARHNSYDHIIPITVDINQNVPQQNIKITMGRHQEEGRNMIAMQNHVTMLVYVSDDPHGQLLKQSSPNSNHYTVVSKGDQYRKQYVILDKDDETTGYRYQIIFFDCEREVTHGHVNHYNHRISQEQFHSQHINPVWNWLLTARNWYKRLTNGPTPGTCGIVVRAIPSSQHQVSHIDLTMRANYEERREENMAVPGVRLNTRVTYSSKTADNQPKLSYDFTLNVEMNAGHTMNDVKVQVTKIVPNQPFEKICVEATKQWINESVSGHYTVMYGQSTENKCMRDSVIDIRMMGMLSEEELHLGPEVVYGECLIDYEMDGKIYPTMRCAAAHGMLRKYQYDIQTTNVEPFYHHMKPAYQFIENYLRMSEYSIDDHVTLPENNYKVIVNYPVDGLHVNMEITTPHHHLNITGLPRKRMQHYFLYKDNMVLPWMFLAEHHLGSMKTCHISPKLIMSDKRGLVHQVASPEYVPYVIDVVDSPKYGVYVKTDQNHNQMVMKMVSEGHTVEVVHGEQGYILTEDGQSVSLEKEHLVRHNPFLYILFGNENYVTVGIEKYQVYVVYDGSHMAVYTMSHMHPTGQCFAS